MQPKKKEVRPSPKKAVHEKPKVSQQKTNNRLNILLALLVAITGFALYVNTLGHGFVLDDYSVINENRITRQGTESITTIFKTSYRSGYYLVNDELYRPLPKAIFATLWEIAPNNPYPGHLLNVLLYALTGFVLYFFLFRIFSNTFFAFAASLLFIAHPLHTEVVANIKSMDEILAFLFCILSGIFLFKRIDKKKYYYLFLSSFFYALALLSKESSVTFLAVFPLLIYFFSKEGEKKNYMPVLTLLCTTLIFLGIRHSVLKDIPNGLPSIADNLLMSAKIPGDKFATAVLILGMYLKLIFFPHPLVFDYSYNQIPVVGMSDGGFVLSLIIHIALLVFAVMQFRKNKIISFAILFYFISISIYANIFLIIGSSFGERFLYIPLLGFAMACGYLLSKLNSKSITDKLSSFLNENKIALLITVGVCSAYGFKTVTRNEDWKSNYSLFSHDVNLSPNSTRTHYYYGNLLAKPEMTEGKDSIYTDSIRTLALSELDKAVAIYPKFGDAYNQMGMTWDRKKNYQKALESYQKAVGTNENNPMVYNNMATLYFNTGQYDEAFKMFDKAVKLKPDYAEAYMNMGSTYGSTKQYDNAINCFLKAIKLDPQLAQAYYFLGITYRFKGDENNAQAYIAKAHKLDPKKY